MKKKAPATTPDQAASQDLVTVLQNAKIPEKHQMSLNEAMTIYDMFSHEAASNDRFCRMNAAYTLGFMRGVDSGMATINKDSSHAATTPNANTQEPINEAARQSIREALDEFERLGVELERARHCMDLFLELTSQDSVTYMSVRKHGDMADIFGERLQATLSRASDFGTILGHTP